MKQYLFVALILFARTAAASESSLRLPEPAVVYSRPDPQSAVMERLPADAVVEVVPTVSGDTTWIKVKLPGALPRVGFIKRTAPATAAGAPSVSVAKPAVPEGILLTAPVPAVVPHSAAGAPAQAEAVLLSPPAALEPEVLTAPHLAETAMAESTAVPPPPARVGGRTAPSVESSRGTWKSTKIRGYVTDVRSTVDFDIEDYRITRDGELVLDFENADSAVRFGLDDVRVGVELEIRGALNEETGELRASAVRVDMEQFKPIKQTAIIGRQPTGVVRTSEGWHGEVSLDGQRVVISPATQIVYKLTSRERKSLSRKQVQPLPDGFRPVMSLDELSIGTAVTYEGRRRLTDGAVEAERIEVISNDLEDGEARMWRSLKVSSTPPRGLKPGELKIDHVGRFKLLADDGVQEYVAAMGRSLVPVYQREMADGTPGKIPFQFYVVKDDSANAFALPTGTVVIHSGLIDLLENEAQLAAIVGHEIAHAVQEHTWRETQYHKKKRIGLVIASAVATAYGATDVANLLDLVEGAVRNGHSRSMENQADRVGLEYMTVAGYDPREAPRVWKLMAKRYGVHATNFFWSTHENHAIRRSYLMNELKNNYRGLDFTSVVVREAEFRRMQDLTRRAASAKMRLTVR